MIDTQICQELQLDLEKIKFLRQRFDLSFNDSINTKDLESLKATNIIKEQLEMAISDLREQLIPKQIQATYTRKDNNAQETIALNIEQKLQEFTDFYQKTSLDLPKDFQEQITEIWKNNIKQIEQAIEGNGFDDALLIPGNIPLLELKQKMEMESGYFLYQVKDDFSDIISQNTDKPRILLFHKLDTLSEINQKTGLDIHLGITGGDALKLYQDNPMHYLSTLDDVLILERKYLNDTNKHLSSWRNRSAQWLPGSMSGDRLVDSCWDPDDGGLGVGASDLMAGRGTLGVRPARCFF